MKLYYCPGTGKCVVIHFFLNLYFFSWPHMYKFQALRQIFIDILMKYFYKKRSIIKNFRITYITRSRQINSLNLKQYNIFVRLLDTFIRQCNLSVWSLSHLCWFDPGICISHIKRRKRFIKAVLSMKPIRHLKPLPLK